MKDESMGSTWITIVLITVIAILIFLVFFGTKGEVELPSLPSSEQPAATPAPSTAKPADVKGS